jgi:hypothetical protein
LKALIDLIYEWDDLGHVIEACAIMLFVAPFAWLVGSPFLPAIAVTAWFHGREKAQWEQEEKRRLNLRSVKPLGHRGWSPLTWTYDGLLDFAVPTSLAWLICVFAAALS